MSRIPLRPPDFPADPALDLSVNRGDVLLAIDRGLDRVLDAEALIDERHADVMIAIADHEAAQCAYVRELEHHRALCEWLQDIGEMRCL